MRNIGRKALLPILCAVALLCSSCGAMVATGSEASRNYEHITAFDIIERDAYLEGIWYPWFTHTYLGSGLAANPDNERLDGFYNTDGSQTDYWQDFNKIGIDEYGISNIKREIFNLKALGYNILGLEGSPWGEGILHDPDTGDVLGVDPVYLTNMRRLLDVCRELEMPVLWAMCFHTSAAVLYSNLDIWYFVCQMYSNPEITANYCEKFVKPVCEVLNEYPDVVAMMCSTVEIENEINDSQLGNQSTGDRETYGVTQEDAVHFVKSVTDTIKEMMPETPVTIATNTSNFAMYADCNFDMVGRNQYSDTPNVIELTQYYATAPMLATEWGVDHGSNYNDTSLASKWKTFRQKFMSNNYAGWIQWAWEPTGRDGGGHHLLKNGATTVYDFRSATYEQYYYIEEYRASKRPGTYVTGKPSMLYYDGVSPVYWIQPKGVTTYKLERSVDGGAWTTVTQNSGAVADASTGGYRYSYQDTGVGGSSVQYRVTVNGHTSYSNHMTPPTNMATNGGFESGNTGWNIQSNYGEVTSAYAHNGSKSLRLKASGGVWTECANRSISVKKNTSYTVSFWVKRISGSGRYALFTKNGNTNINAGCIFFSHTNTDWVYCEATFNSGNYTTIDFRFQANDDANPGQFAVDDFCLYQVES